MKDKLFKVNEFARIFDITVKTLHFYDKINVFSPCYVNNTNNYRYYSYNQIEELAIILQFKNMGFSLSDIKSLLSQSLSIEQKYQLISFQRDQIDEMLQKYERLIKAKIELQAYILESKPEYVVSEQRIFKDVNHIYDTYHTLSQYCIKERICHNIPFRTICRYNDSSFSLTNIDAIIYVCVNRKEHKRVSLLPSQKFLCTLFIGELEDLYKAYEFLYNYALNNNISLDNYSFEHYELNTVKPSIMNDLIIEVRLPVITI